MRTQREGRDAGAAREGGGTRPGFGTRSSLLTGLVGIAGLTGGLLAAPAAAVPAAATAPAASPAAGLDGLSGQEVADEAKKQLKTMKSVRMKLKSDSLTLALTLDRRGDCTGKADMGRQGSITLTKKGHTVWLKPDRAFWESQIGGEGAAVDDFVDGRYIKGTTDDEMMGGMDTTCSLNTLRNSVNTASGSDGQQPGDSAAPGKWKRGAASEYRDKEAVTVSRDAAGSRMTMLVSDDGKPYPLKLTRSGQGSTETIELGRFDKPIPGGTPSEQDTLRIAELEKHLNSPSDAPSSQESV